MAEGEELGSNVLLSWSVQISTCETDPDPTRRLDTLENLVDTVFAIARLGSWLR